MIQTLSKLGMQGNFLNQVKGTEEKPAADIILRGEVPKCLPCGQGRTRMPTVAATFNSGSSRGVRQEKETRGVQIRKEEVKPSAGDMFSQIENPKESTVN